MKSQIFHGAITQVQEELATFLKDKNLKILGFAQSQSTNGNDVAITITLLYTEYNKERSHITGFNRE